MNDLRQYSRSKDVLTKLGEELRSFLDTFHSDSVARQVSPASSVSKLGA